VLGDAVAVHEVEGLAEDVCGDARAGAHAGDRGLDGLEGGGAFRLIEVEVGLEAVAGGDDDRSGQVRVPLDDAACRAGRADGQLLEYIETRVLVVRGQADQHSVSLLCPSGRGSYPESIRVLKV